MGTTGVGRDSYARAIGQFIEMNLELGDQEKETLQILVDLHSIQNDPSTRMVEGSEISGSLMKARYIEEKAKSILNDREDCKDISIELVEAVDPITGSTTYNVVITLSSNTLGPVVDVMAHHDTIDARDYSLSILDENDEYVLFGRTLQDDTIHAAALLAALKYLSVPDSGAIRLVFTDYEENGCRGSSALIEKLLTGIPESGQYAVVALESTMGNLAYGHRGKFSAFAESIFSMNPQSAYIDWYERLAWIQRELNRNSGTSKLGKTVGTSTFGTIGNGKLFARLDFRTNSVMTPKLVEEKWKIAISEERNFDPDILIHAKRSIKNHEYDIKISDDTITIKSGNIPTHPSAFNPEDDGTVMPVIYLLLHCMCGEIDTITWGDRKRQNSNPMIGTVKFKQTLPADLTSENLMKKMKSAVGFGESAQQSSLQIGLNHVDKSACVETNLIDGVFNNIHNEFNRSLDLPFNHIAKPVTVNYMTDAARIFNCALKKGIRTYGMVFGVGDPKYLHKTENDVRQNERLSSKDVILATKGLILLPQIIHRELINRKS